MVAWKLKYWLFGNCRDARQDTVGEAQMPHYFEYAFTAIPKEPKYSLGDKMKTRIMSTLVIALVAEIGTSGWEWGRFPTDTIRVIFNESFFLYQMSRLLPWIVLMTVMLILYHLIAVRRGVKSDG
mgnify:CR=1 FL=1